MTIIFMPLPSVVQSKKCRANAPVITNISYFHESFALKDFLSKVLIILKHDDCMEHSWLYHGHEHEEPNSFSTSYTVPWHLVDQVEIHEDEDYKQIIEEATQKIFAEVKVFIIENKVCFIPLLHFQCSNNTDTGRGWSWWGFQAWWSNSIHRRKRRWGVISSFSTLFHGFFVEPIFTRENCASHNDSRSQTLPLLRGQTLWPDTMLCCAEHVHLMHMHLRTWAGNCCTVSIFIKITLIFFLLGRENRGCQCWTSTE